MNTTNLFCFIRISILEFIIKSTYDGIYQINTNPIESRLILGFPATCTNNQVIIFQKYLKIHKLLRTKHQSIYSKFRYRKRLNAAILLQKKTEKKTRILSFIRKYKDLTHMATPRSMICQNYSRKQNMAKNSRINTKYQSSKFDHFFSSLFRKIFNKDVYLINFNYAKRCKVPSMDQLVNNLLFKYRFFRKTRVVYKIFQLVLASLMYKDTKILMHTLKMIFECVHYSKHRMYFNFWKFLIRSFLTKFYKKFSILGVRLEFHGKLGVGGNSKKRSYYFHKGRCTNSTKDVRMDSSNFFFGTTTGVVGFTYAIFY